MGETNEKFNKESIKNETNTQFNNQIQEIEQEQQNMRLRSQK